MSNLEKLRTEDVEHYESEVDMVVPGSRKDVNEAYELLNAACVSFDVHVDIDSIEYPSIYLQAHGSQFFGIAGVRRFLDYRQRGFFDTQIKERRDKGWD